MVVRAVPDYAQVHVQFSRSLWVATELDIKTEYGTNGYHLVLSTSSPSSMHPNKPKFNIVKCMIVIIHVNNLK